MPHINQLHWIIFQQSNVWLLCPPWFFWKLLPHQNWKHLPTSFFGETFWDVEVSFFPWLQGWVLAIEKMSLFFFYNHNHEKKDPWLFRAFVRNDTTQFFMGIISHACIRTSWKQTVNAPEKHWGCGFRPRTCDICPNGKSVGCFVKLGTDNSTCRIILTRYLIGPPMRSSTVLESNVELKCDVHWGFSNNFDFLQWSPTSLDITKMHQIDP